MHSRTNRMQKKLKNCQMAFKIALVFITNMCMRDVCAPTCVHATWIAALEAKANGLLPMLENAGAFR